MFLLARISRRQLTDEMVDTMLYNTPPKHRGSKKFFRNLENDGLISYMEYLFLWVILTSKNSFFNQSNSYFILEPSTEFEIAFAMFDTDGKIILFFFSFENLIFYSGNQLVDKREFLMVYFEYS